MENNFQKDLKLNIKTNSEMSDISIPKKKAITFGVEKIEQASSKMGGDGNDGGNGQPYDT